MSLEDTIQGLQSAAEYLGRTRELVSQQTFAQVQEQQCRSWMQSIQRLQIRDMAESSRLMEVIVECGGFEESHRQRLLEAVAKRGQGGSACASSPAKQTMVNWVAYLTLAEKDYLGSPSSSLAKLDLMSTRMLKIGLVSPTERSAGHVIASLGLHQALSTLF